MVKGSCRTNLDDWKHYEWPKVFAEVPRVGDSVQGIGQGAITRPTLKVVAVTHLVDREGQPRIEVELHR